MYVEKSFVLVKLGCPKYLFICIVFKLIDKYVHMKLKDLANIRKSYEGIG